MDRPSKSFYAFMQEYPHEQPERQQLARALKQLAKKHGEVKKIDSLMDLMQISFDLLGQEDSWAVTGDLWCTYCAVCNHPF